MNQVASLFEVRLDGAAPTDQWLGLLLEGFHLAPRGMGGLSTVITEDDVDEFVRAAVRVGQELTLTPARDAG